MAVRIAYLARSSGPAALQAPTHTAQASASAYEVDWGGRPVRHQRWTRTRAVSSVTGSRRTTMLVLPPLDGQEITHSSAPAGVPRRHRTHISALASGARFLKLNPLRRAERVVD